jgi:ankyrin repeat protein
VCVCVCVLGGGGQLDAGRTLLESGMDGRRANDEGSLPLHYAAMRGDARMAALLLASHPDPRDDACSQARTASPGRAGGEEGRAGQGRAGQVRAGEGQGRAKQGRAGQGLTEM